MWLTWLPAGLAAAAAGTVSFGALYAPNSSEEQYGMINLDLAAGAASFEPLVADPGAALTPDSALDPRALVHYLFEVRIWASCTLVSSNSLPSCPPARPPARPPISVLCIVP